MNDNTIIITSSLIIFYNEGEMLLYTDLFGLYDTCSWCGMYHSICAFVNVQNVFYAVCICAWEVVLCICVCLHKRVGGWVQACKCVSVCHRAWHHLFAFPGPFLNVHQLNLTSEHCQRSKQSKYMWQLGCDRDQFFNFGSCSAVSFLFGSFLFGLKKITWPPALCVTPRKTSPYKQKSIEVTDN